MRLELAEMESGSTFHRVLWDDLDARLSGGLKPAKDIRRVVMCSGKVYYDLVEAREAAGIDDVYILRLEQLYPFRPGRCSPSLKPMTMPNLSGVRKSPKIWAPGHLWNRRSSMC